MYYVMYMNKVVAICDTRNEAEQVAGQWKSNEREAVIEFIPQPH